LIFLFREHFAQWCTGTIQFQQGKAKYLDSEETKLGSRAIRNDKEV
jgi:hypothetical protein